MPAWYDDWLLTIEGSGQGMGFVRIDLPNNDGQQTFIVPTTNSDGVGLANLLDKLLSELTKTKPGLLRHGRHPADTA